MFNSEEFEKKIPYSMRFKEWYRVKDNCLYWVTQQGIDDSELAQFQRAFIGTGFKACYLIVRDDSTYDFEYDFEHREDNGMIKVTPVIIWRNGYSS